MPFGRRPSAAADASPSSPPAAGAAAGDDGAGVDQYARFTTVLRAIEFECRLKREWQNRTSPAGTPERRDSASSAADGPGTSAAGASGDGHRADGAPSAADERQHRDQERPFFEHFVVCGLPPDADVVAAAVSSRQAKNARQSGADAITSTSRLPAYRQPGGPMYPAQVLYSWSRGRTCAAGGPGGRAGGDAAASGSAQMLQLVSDLCFPNGVGPSLVERRPSMSDINELLYGLKFEKEDSSFTFIMKGSAEPPGGGGHHREADAGLPRNLYGVAISENEMMRLAPSKLMMRGAAGSSPGGDASASSERLLDKRYIVTAPRCYCLLSYHPFFELHFDILSTVLKIERVERLRMLMAEPAAGPASTAPGAAPPPRAREEEQEEHGDSSQEPRTGAANGSASEPPDGGVAAAAAAAEPPPPPSPREQQSIPSKLLSAAATATTAAVASLSTMSIGTRGANGRDSSSSPSGSGRNSPTGACSPGGGASGPSTPTFTLMRSRALSRSAAADPGGPDGPGAFGVATERRSSKLGLLASSGSPSGAADAPAGDGTPRGGGRAACGEDGEDGAEEDDVSTILTEYWRAPVPRRGYSRTIEFTAAPLEVKFKRWHAPRDSSIPYTEGDVNMQLSEAAGSAGAWSVCTLCKSLSLENMITMLSCVLLEKQMVVFCPSLGVLTGVVWSMQPLILPFVWQSVLFPVMPSSMIEFLDAPVPFIAGIQHKTDVVREKSSDLIRVNVYKDKINYNPRPALGSIDGASASASGRVLLLPKHGQLAATISSHYEILAKSGPGASSGPIFRVSKQERKHAEAIIALVNRHLVGLCSNILHHRCAADRTRPLRARRRRRARLTDRVTPPIAPTTTSITHVNEKNQRVTLLLKESFLGSFADSEHGNFGGGASGSGAFHAAANSGGGFSTNEREFMEMFVETQMFNAYSDSIFLQQQQARGRG